MQEGQPTLGIYMQKEARKAAIPGVSYALVDHGRLVSVGAFGERRAGGHEPVTTATPFELGSISKSFTAVAVMQLVEAGKVGLDKPIAAYLPEFVNEPAGAITVRQLLSHTSGYSEEQGNHTQNDLAMDSEALARRVRRLARTKPAREPGAVWEYSNANYQILGRLMERVETRPFGLIIESRILRPLGMRDSYVQDGRRTTQAARGHRPWFGGKIANARGLIGAGSAPQGGIVSSARDMALYMSILLNDRDDIISVASKRQMMRSAGAAAPAYGFGWSVDRRNGVVSHSGANPGFEALVAMTPAQQRGVVVLTNAGSGFGWGGTAALRYGLASRALRTQIPSEPAGAQKGTLAALVMLLAFFVFATLDAWRRSKALPVNEERRRRSCLAASLPLILAVALVSLLLVLFPAIAGVDIVGIILFIPDLGLVLILTSAMAVVWGLAQLAFDPPSPARQSRNAG